MANKIVYIVTSGEYSDYRIRGVFLEKSKAENFLKIFGNNAQIEEFEVGANAKNDEFYFTVLFFDELGDIDINLTMPNKKSKDLVLADKTGKRSHCVYCWAKDKEHAKKKAIDMRTKWLAEVKGV